MSDRSIPSTPAPEPLPGAGPRNRERSAVGWLLAVPVLLVLFPPLYNRVEPRLFGIPFFYWFQLAVIPVSVVCTTAVYRATRRRSQDDDQWGRR